MNLIFRLLWTLLISRFRSPAAIVGPCRTPFHVWPTDLDVLRHMNNGKYLTILDLARVDLMIRAGLQKTIAKNQWYPVVVAETIRFKKSLQVFQTFEVETRVIGWDEKAFLLQQEFIRKNQVVASAVIRARFLKVRGGTVSTSEVLAAARHNDPSPALPEWIQRWNEEQAAASKESSTASS